MTLRRHPERLDPDCRGCDYDYVSLGKLEGILMGKGWVRTTTHTKCPVHGDCQICGKRPLTGNERKEHAAMHAAATNMGDVSAVPTTEDEL